MDCSLPGSSVHGVSQARILEWVVTSFSRDLPDPGTESVSPALAGGFLASCATMEAQLSCAAQLRSQCPRAHVLQAGTPLQ